jgi:hypothetical protein
VHMRFGNLREDPRGGYASNQAATYRASMNVGSTGLCRAVTRLLRFSLQRDIDVKVFPILKSISHLILSGPYIEIPS